MKKFIALILVLAMVLSMSTVAFAAAQTKFLTPGSSKMSTSLITTILTNAGIDYSIAKQEPIMTYIKLYNEFVATVAESIALQVYNMGVARFPVASTGTVAEQAVFSSAKAVAYTVYYILSFAVK